jgi:hypothetical protein
MHYFIASRGLSCRRNPRDRSYYGWVYLEAADYAGQLHDAWRIESW